MATQEELIRRRAILKKQEAALQKAFQANPDAMNNKRIDEFQAIQSEIKSIETILSGEANQVINGDQYGDYQQQPQPQRRAPPSVKRPMVRRPAPPVEEDNYMQQGEPNPNNYPDEPQGQYPEEDLRNYDNPYYNPRTQKVEKPNQPPRGRAANPDRYDPNQPRQPPTMDRVAPSARPQAQPMKTYDQWEQQYQQARAAGYDPRQPAQQRPSFGLGSQPKQPQYGWQPKPQPQYRQGKPILQRMIGLVIIVLVLGISVFLLKGQPVADLLFLGIGLISGVIIGFVIQKMVL